MKQEHHPLDDLIRQRINSLPPADVRGWEQLQSRLDEQQDDAAIAAKLATLTPAAPTGSWDAFAEKLDAAEAADHRALDAAVVRGLERAAPGSVSGWSALAARLELIGKRREMVACLKITEGALLLSFLLLLARFGDSGYRNATAPIAGATQPSTASSFGQPPAPPAAGDGAALAPKPGANPAATEVARPAEITYARPGAATSPLPAADLAPLSVPRPELSLRPATAPVEALESTALSPLPAGRFGGTPTPLVSRGEPVRYYLNAFVSPVDLNEVVTQQNKVLGINEQRFLTTGYSAGALLEATQSGNALQFGLIYGNRSYVPAKIRLFSVDPASGAAEDEIAYSQLSYQTVSIPLNYERELVTRDRWRLSAGFGMAMNVVLESHVSLPADITLDDLNRMIQDRAAEVGAGRSKAEGSVKEILDPTRGYFDGGGLLENSSLYLSGNFRIERIVNNRWSFYFSPTIGKLVTVREGDGGRGPLEDRIHNTMLRLGTRVRLTKK